MGEHLSCPPTKVRKKHPFLRDGALIVTGGVGCGLVDWLKGGSSAGFLLGLLNKFDSKDFHYFILLLICLAFVVFFSRMVMRFYTDQTTKREETLKDERRMHQSALGVALEAVKESNRRLGESLELVTCRAHPNIAELIKLSHDQLRVLCESTYRLDNLQEGIKNLSTAQRLLEPITVPRRRHQGQEDARPGTQQ